MSSMDKVVVWIVAISMATGVAIAAIGVYKEVNMPQQKNCVCDEY